MPAEAGHQPAHRVLGAYYTPPDIAQTLTRWAVRGNAGPVLDPSYGICRFLDAAVDVLAENGAPHPERSVHGFDVDARATADTTAKLLARGALPDQFTHRDFFSIHPDPKFAAVLGNPPYVRHHWQAADVKQAASDAMESAGVRVSKRASLWAPFVVHAGRFVRPGGRLAMLLPGSALQARYATAVWEHLSNLYGTVTLVRIGERAFEDALEETVVLLADQHGGSGGRAALTVEIDSFADLADALASDPALYSLRKRGRGSSKARTTLSSRRLLDIARSHEQAASLGAVATVRIGTVTGANSLFIRAADDPLVRGLPDSEVMRVVPGSRALLGATWSTTDDDTAVRSGSRCRLILLRKDRRLRGRIGAAVDAAEAESIHERSQCARRSPWWSVASEQPPDAFLAYMGATARGIVRNDLPAGCVNGVHRITWTVPDGDVYVPSTWTSLWAMAVEQTARHYAGGVLKLEPGTAPGLPVVRCDEPGAVARLDLILRTEGVAAARDFADELVLKRILGFSAEQIDAVRAAVNSLVTRRSPPIRGA